jgi:hypothetical protein
MFTEPGNGGLQRGSVRRVAADLGFTLHVIRNPVQIADASFHVPRNIRLHMQHATGRNVFPIIARRVVNDVIAQGIVRCPTNAVNPK